MNHWWRFSTWTAKCWKSVSTRCAKASKLNGGDPSGREQFGMEPWSKNQSHERIDRRINHMIKGSITWEIWLIRNWMSHILNNLTLQNFSQRPVPRWTIFPIVSARSLLCALAIASRSKRRSRPNSAAFIMKYLRRVQEMSQTKDVPKESLPECIRVRIFLQHLDWINNISQRFGHFSPITSNNKTVSEHGFYPNRKWVRKIRRWIIKQ